MPQELMLVEKKEQGEIHTRNIIGVAFVPLQEENPDYSNNDISY